MRFDLRELKKQLNQPHQVSLAPITFRTSMFGEGASVARLQSLRTSGMKRGVEIQISRIERQLDAEELKDESISAYRRRA